MILPICLALLAIVAFFVFYYYNLYKQKYFRLIGKVTADSKAISELPPRDWKAHDLHSLRSKGDPLADATIAHIFSDIQDVKVVNNLFKLLTSDDMTLPDDVHPAIKKYFEESAILPEWTNRELMSFGHEYYLSQGILVGMLLFYKSLPECYTAGNGAAVLLRTTLLNDRSPNLDKLSDRLALTGTFIYKAMMPGSMEPKGEGIVSTQKIRLIHAASRYFILNRNKGTSEQWDTEKLGIPVNQEDMAGTLMAFSALVLEGLEILGVKMTTAERESYIHAWRVIGHIMGVENELLPINANDALNLGHAIIDDQMAPSEAGKALTESLLNFCEKKAPWFVSRDFHKSMLRFLMGDKLADMLGVNPVAEEHSQKFIGFIKWYVSVRQILSQYFFWTFFLRSVDKVLLKLSYEYLSKKSSKDIHFQLPKDPVTRA